MPLARRAAVLAADVAQHPHTRRHDVELLAHHLGEALELDPVMRAGALRCRQRMFDVDPLQRVGYAHLVWESGIGNRDGRGCLTPASEDSANQEANLNPRAETASIPVFVGRKSLLQKVSHATCVTTGVVEGAGKSVIANGLKRGGMHRTVDSANAIIALRCAIASNRFDDYWECQASTA